MFPVGWGEETGNIFVSCQAKEGRLNRRGETDSISFRSGRRRKIGTWMFKLVDKIVSPVYNYIGQSIVVGKAWALDYPFLEF